MAAKTFPNLNGDNLNKEGRQAFADRIMYSNTKLCNVLFTIELAKNLEDKLKNSAPCRIVNVSSLAAKLLSNLDPDNLNKHPEGGQTQADHIIYANTKLCNILFTIELAKKLEGTGVTANALHPGSIKTELLRTTSGFYKYFITVVRNLFFKTVEEGAQTQIYVALSKDIEGISGELFDSCRQIEMYECAKDVTLVKKVWKKSEEFVKLKAEEKL